MKQPFIAALIGGCIFTLALSCKYDEALAPEPDPGIEISFANDIIPIFNASCNSSGCHNGAGPSPDLREAVAYESLFSGTLIDTLQPDHSELYLWMSGQRGLPMPIEGVNAGYVATVLQWIEQGALNN
jgi:hypothetical protein